MKYKYAVHLKCFNIHILKEGQQPPNKLYWIKYAVSCCASISFTTTSKNNADSVVFFHFYAKIVTKTPISETWNQPEI